MRVSWLYCTISRKNTIVLAITSLLVLRLTSILLYTKTTFKFTAPIILSSIVKGNFYCVSTQTKIKLQPKRYTKPTTLISSTINWSQEPLAEVNFQFISTTNKTSKSMCVWPYNLDACFHPSVLLYYSFVWYGLKLIFICRIFRGFGNQCYWVPSSKHRISRRYRVIDTFQVHSQPLSNELDLVLFNLLS